MKYVLKHKTDNLYLNAIDFTKLPCQLARISRISKNPEMTFETKNNAQKFLDEYGLQDQYNVKRVIWFTEILWEIKPFRVMVEQLLRLEK